MSTYYFRYYVSDSKFWDYEIAKLQKDGTIKAGDALILNSRSDGSPEVTSSDFNINANFTHYKCELYELSKYAGPIKKVDPMS